MFVFLDSPGPASILLSHLFLDKYFELLIAIAEWPLTNDTKKYTSKQSTMQSLLIKSNRILSDTLMIQVTFMT